MFNILERDAVSTTNSSANLQRPFFRHHSDVPRNFCTNFHYRQFRVRERIRCDRGTVRVKTSTRNINGILTMIRDHADIEVNASQDYNEINALSLTVSKPTNRDHQSNLCSNPPVLIGISPAAQQQKQRQQRGASRSPRNSRGGEGTCGDSIAFGGH